MSELDWGAMLRRAVGVGLSPRDFWGLSWREWCLLHEPAAARPSPTGDELLALMRRFPDGEAG